MKARSQPKIPAPYVSFANVYAVPSLHGRMRFAALVRQAYHALKPDAAAVELPATLEATIRKGVSRLPFLSVVAYEDYTPEIEKVWQILPITPEDSLIEAVRQGTEHGVPVHFIDRDVIGHQARPVSLPDDYLVARIGLDGYWEAVEAALPAPTPGSDDDLREVEMAARLRVLSERHKRVLFVCGMAHLKGVMRHFAKAPVPPPGSVTQREQTLYNLAWESTPRILDGMGYVTYAYELARCGLHPQQFPQLAPLPSAKGPAQTAAQEAWRETVSLLVETLRSSPSGIEEPDTYGLLTDLARGAADLYAREWNEQLAPLRLNTLLRYARNLALVKRRFTPSEYELLLAGKNTVNDDYAFQLLRLAEYYPFYEDGSDLPELKVQGDGTGEAEGETLELRLRLPRGIGEELEASELGLEDPPEEVAPGFWQERWEMGDQHVSHPPEDVKVEDFFQYLRGKCRRLIADQQVRVHELQASLMDGLDLRETLRNLPQGKLYVRENLPGVGDVGPVVVIFHKPGEEQAYPHEMMWFAEHDGESDLALYSTEPGKQLDGPGISRCQYGGVLSLFPPTGRAFVWGNPRYEGGHGRAETLLKAAIDLSRKPIVAYAAPEGPSAEMLALAGARGIRIMYLPLDMLSADLIKRVRTFHILADRYIRPLAHLYIR